MPVSILQRLKLWSRFFPGISYPRGVLLVWNAPRFRPRHSLPESVWKAVDAIDGFLSIKEAGLL
jgi:hypothetical protein